MKLLIHDLPQEDFDACFPAIEADTVVVSALEENHPCIGCFGCWIKTPGACVIRDRYGDMGALLGKCRSVRMVTRCTYGGLSPACKNVLDRSISYLLPYFELRGGEMHHLTRYPERRLELEFVFYGDITPEERRTAEQLAEANAKNFDATYSVQFYADIGSIKEAAI